MGVIRNNVVSGLMPVICKRETSFDVASSSLVETIGAIAKGLTGIEIKYETGFYGFIDKFLDEKLDLEVYKEEIFAEDSSVRIAVRHQFHIWTTGEKLYLESWGRIQKKAIVLFPLQIPFLLVASGGLFVNFKIQGKLAGNIPYGYDLHADGENLIANKKEQEALAIMQELRTRGISFGKIVKELHERGYRAKSGGMWYAGTIQKILEAQK